MLKQRFTMQVILCRAPGTLLAAVVLFGLVACGTAPVRTPVATIPAAAPAVTPSPAAAQGDSATPGDLPIADAPPIGPRPALLGGESAREFQRGGASWYGPGFHGRRTASGDRFNMHALTAAHRTLPFGTLVRVHSLVNGREVEVRITDRGPYIHGRIIDLSRSAAQALDMLGLGFKEVVLMVPESTPMVSPLPPPAPAPVRRAPARRQPSR
ncbi:septal ring lytic transglycosylase RlpA family protein [Polaromonas sp. YR568]|jgi:rare lipoprotein A|uniref:septal ring lytic transglycosylase RlpA family protein n=1 Tax=Polaromonas sp. YR568 TaxID=1855301 RepID=UPI0031382D0A